MGGIAENRTTGGGFEKTRRPYTFAYQKFQIRPKSKRILRIF